MATRKKTSTSASDAPALVMNPQHEQAIIAAALAIVEARLKASTFATTSPGAAKSFLALQLGALEREVFGVMFLDAQHRLIAFEIMFQGTLTKTSVYPREVARRALGHNAAAVVLAHNHPSGVTTPSAADKALTRALQSCLDLVEVRVLDHIVIGGVDSFSFAEHGLMPCTMAAVPA